MQITMNNPKNIVLIVLDTQRANRLSCYNDNLHTTPFIDSFAEEGIRFDSAISTAQWTIPTHASIFTGLYPSQHTMSQMNSKLPAAIPTLAERLQQSGYSTACFSNNPLIGSMQNGLERGFSHLKNYSFFGAGLLNTQLNNDDIKQSSSKERLKHIIRIFLAELVGYRTKTPVHKLSSLAYPMWQKFLDVKGISKYGRSQQSLNDALAYLTNEKEKPCFVFINLMGAHTPYAPPSWALKKYLSPDVPTRETLQFINNLQVDVDNWLDIQLPNKQFSKALDAIYNAEVSAQDALIGNFIANLKNNDLWEQTLFIITADHGDHLGEKERVNHAFGTYNELTHVPLIMRNPANISPIGKNITMPISSRRLFHSILDFAGIADTLERNLSLLTLNDNLESSSQELGEDVFVEGLVLEWATKRIQKSRPKLTGHPEYKNPTYAVYSDGYKLITNGETVTGLFDITADGTESLNLDSKLPQKTDLLREKIQLFKTQMIPIAEPTKETTDDQIIIEQLKALGYLE